ncbi:phage antirepressor N-terminal domain-containing protein [Azospirillum sp. A1-3]|uniref:phage antirepressor N-terminal domain-containing protein n=1 Tax=Azospirillum sp. A1-3 TaxID=185874 RepID=UPI00207788AF|nr:phage antirepressor N-terminal domain-containing protein [Azospirillum sp. A1-3]MCM8735956.1 phage antirepressor N-terminal domain-containing protein [Azospirillum sp. A1-3]
MSDLTVINFHGADLVAIKGADQASTLVAMKPVAEGMGLSWQPQHRKLMEHPVLSTCVTIRMMQMPGDIQSREWFFLPLDKLNFWLATIQPNRVTDEAVKAKVIDYQRECADVLFAHFFAKAGGDVPAKPDEMLRRMDGMLRMLSHKGTVTEKAVVSLQEDVASLASIVRDLVKCADGRLAVIDAVPALQIATDAKVPKAGRRPIVQEISRKLTRFCADHGYVVRRDARGTKLYTVNAVNEWRLSGGDSLIRKLVAANTVIGPLFAIRGGKDQPSA